jgi:pimeloyl-ACP methyl ester carboxylesterase
MASDLAGLVRHLAAVSALADQPGGSGTVEVQTIRAPDGGVRHVVYLPGTDDLATTPWSQDADARDLGTNLLLVGGQDNAYQQGVLDALRQAGVGPGEPVALVGHSQGGMVAAALASQSQDGSPYSFTQVVTAGSPTAHLNGFPPGCQVLSLEAHGDVVPLLDGEDNPDSAEQVTVRFDDAVVGVVADHELGHYAAGAEAVQVSADPSVRDQLDSLVAAGFVGPADGQEVTSQVFRITRAHDRAP